MKIHAIGSKLFNADGRTYIQKELG